MASKPRARSLPLLGVKELAAQLGITPSSLAFRRTREGFPRPVAELACGPVWHQRDIDRYLRQDPHHPDNPHYQRLNEILHQVPLPRTDGSFTK
jgi:hypothetical protein